MPLFLEELTKAVLETSLFEHATAGTRTSACRPGDTASLQDSLVARLDRLAPVREVAQIAACLGREFDHALLAAVSPLPRPELAEALDLLVARRAAVSRRRVRAEAGTASSTPWSAMSPTPPC